MIDTVIDTVLLWSIQMVNEQKEDHVVGQFTRSPVEWNPVEGKDALR